MGLKRHHRPKGKTAMRVPVAGAPDIRATPRDGTGLTLYQGDVRICMTNADIVDFIQAVITIAEQNAAGLNSRKPRKAARTRQRDK